jgi:low affinity Fe/Cu permease
MPIVKVASFIVQDPRYVGLEISQQLAKSSENVVAFQTIFVLVISFAMFVVVLLASFLLRNVLVKQLPYHFLILHMMFTSRFLEKIDTFGT